MRRRIDHSPRATWGQGRTAVYVVALTVVIVSAGAIIRMVMHVHSNRIIQVLAAICRDADACSINIDTDDGTGRQFDFTGERAARLGSKFGATLETHRSRVEADMRLSMYCKYTITVQTPTNRLTLRFTRVSARGLIDYETRGRAMCGTIELSEEASADFEALLLACGQDNTIDGSSDNKGQ